MEHSLEIKNQLKLSRLLFLFLLFYFRNLLYTIYINYTNFGLSEVVLSQQGKTNIVEPQMPASTPSYRSH